MQEFINPLCECPGPGYCKRHGIDKTLRKFQICKGINCDSSTCAKYWNAWEDGAQPGQEGPVENKKPFSIVEQQHLDKRRLQGAGDWVSQTIKKWTGISSCGGCKDRAAKLNEYLKHFFPPDLPPVEPIELKNPIRHLMMHIWPVAGFGAWEWNCDRLLEHAHLFNGYKIISIVTSAETDAPETVKERLKGFADEFIILRNHKQLREVVTWIPMLERLEKYQRENDVTFSCHAKGVRHKISSDISGSTIFLWAKAMFDTCLYWPAVEGLLKTNATVGTFRRYTGPEWGGWGPWHWTGTYFWFRNRDAFLRNWRYVPQRFYGTEAWPGILFKPEEAAPLVLDGTGDLYRMDYWQSIAEPALQLFWQKYLQVSNEN